MGRCIRHVLVLILAAVLAAPALARTIRPTGGSVPGEIVVKIRERASANDIAALERAADADSSKRLAKLTSGTLWRMHSRSKSAEALAAALQHNPNVEYAEPNFIVKVAATANDPSYAQLWGLRNIGQSVGGSLGAAGADIDAEVAWNVTKGSAAIVVGVVDTGIDYTHPDLAANMWTNPGGKGNAACAAGTFGFNAITGTCNPMDDHDHGTHVAGTIGAVGNNGVGVAGVNWDVSLMALKFIAASGSGTIADAIEAIDFAVQAKIGGVNLRVLSNSWGGGPFSKALLDVINKANEHDILFVAAAGNDASNTDVYDHYPSNYATPNMISVAATDNRDELAYFSNYGATTVHLGAPGVAVLSTVPGGYAYFNGTSMATPHVSGVAALMLAKTPALTTAQLKTALLASVDPIASLAGITTTGGRLNAAKAVGAPASPDFSLSVTPKSRTAVRGSSTSYAVAVLPANGFNGSATLSVTGLPAGATATFTPPATSSTSTLTITTSHTTPLAVASLVITATSGAMSRVAFASLATVTLPALGACPSFQTYGSFSGFFSAVTAADFNRDGRMDVATADPANDRIAVRLGGAAGLQAAISYIVGKNPLSIVSADFNGDGRPDLATANAGTHDVSILLGNGDGTFQAAIREEADVSPFSVAAGDFNRDGTTDLAVANNGSSNVSVLLGEGDGTFADAANYAAASGPYWVTAADVDRDGRLDLAVANFHNGTVSILRGNGDGSFQAPLNTSAGAQPSSVAAADFNRDGAIDLAVTNYGSSTVSILAGNGNGTFASPVSRAVGTQPSSVAAGDLNDDGNTDLVTADSGSSMVTVLLGAGNGSFPDSRSIAAYVPQQAVIADITGDGKPDVVTAGQETYYGYGLMVSRNTSDCAFNCGTFAGAVLYGAGTNPDSLARGDFNRDGKLDLAVANYDSSNVSVKLGNGDGTFSAGLTLAVGTAPHGVAAGDFNRDGRLDLAVGRTGVSKVAILLGNGDGTFQSAVSYATGTNPRSVAAGDFDRDGKLDLAVASRGANSVSILRGSGTGTFEAPVSYATGNSPESVAIGDFNRDGRADLVVANSGSANVSLLLGNAGGTFASAVQFGAGTTPYAVIAEDLDNDGRTDIAVANAGSHTVSVLLANGNATFQAAASHPVGNVPHGLAAVDLNRDGRLDLVTANDGSNGISVLIASGGGAYSPAAASNAGTSPSAIAAGDFNRDGKPDLAVTDSGASAVAVLLNVCPVPDLTVTKTHSGSFTQGQGGKTYTITVKNTGAATTGTVTVADALPAGLTATAMSGAGWTCTVSPASCSRSDALGGGASYPPITLTVKVAGNAQNLTNVVTVSGGGELNTLNSTASDPTTIAAATDLVVTKTHVGSFAQGATGRVYTLRVRNIGDLASSGTVTVTDTLPAGLTATGMSGPGWTCNIGSLSCTRGGGLAGRSSHPPITLTVSVAANAPALVTNTAAVSGGGDSNLSNNTAADPTAIWSSQSCGSFGAAAFVSAGWYAAGVAVDDFNHDGKQDMAVANANQNTVSVLLGKGDGSFAAAVAYSLAAKAREIAAGDLDGDGHVDLIAASDDYQAGGGASILRGNGDGTFGPETRYLAGDTYEMSSIAVGDIDGDGNLDVAMTSYYRAFVYVFRGNGDGTLQPVTSFGTISDAYSVAITDLDGNATADLAVNVTGGVAVLLGRGDGTFLAAVKHGTMENSGGTLGVGDFNGDGTTDLAASSYWASGVFVLLGQGDGTFGKPVLYESQHGASSVTASDIDADGKIDLVVYGSSYGLSILLGHGDGTFAAASRHDAGSSGTQVAVSDFNGDGKPDLAVPNYYGSVAILLGGCADLKVTKSHSGNFRGGQTGASYRITIKNVGTGSASGPTTVKDILPPGLTATNIGASSWQWDCDLDTLTCTSDIDLEPEQEATITVTVDVSTAAPSSVVNVATVSGGGDTNPANNSASDPTTIVQAADLTIEKTHTGVFTLGQTGVYTIRTANVGSGPTAGTVTVVDHLPFGMSVVSMGGSGWSCDIPTRTCTRSDVLGATQIYPSITLTVTVNAMFETTTTNVATVSGGGEVVTSNNIVYDVTELVSAPTVAAEAEAPTQVLVTWSNIPAATTYEVWRSSNKESFVQVGTTLTPLFLDGGVTANKSYRYKVRALAGAVAGPFSQPDLATTFFFTDDPIVVRSTPIKAIHIHELRSAVNIVRAAAGLPAATFNAVVTPGRIIEPGHLIEVATALNQARTTFGQSAVSLGSGVSSGSVIYGAHMTALRNLMK